MKTIATVVLTVLTLSQAHAETISGTWSTADGCTRLELMKTDPDAAWEGDFIEISYLTKKGIAGYEWGCDFLDTKTNDYGLNVHLSACSYGPDSWPDLLMTKFDTKTGWTVIVTEDNGNIAEEYYPVQCKK
jgi:hypothetical protein